MAVAVCVPHAEPPEFDPWPLFAGARWVYRNATVDFNPEVHPVRLLTAEVLANVYCIDRMTGAAWECFALHTTEHPDRGQTAYVHRTTDSLLQFSSTLQDRDSDFPGFVALRYPVTRDTYWVYNVPRATGATGDTALWDQAQGCSGVRSLLEVGGQGECSVASDVALLRIIHDRETVGMSNVADSLLGGYTAVFTQAWKMEVYNGIEEYPDYHWWAREPEYTWLVPSIGPVKQVARSSVFELTRFVHAEEILHLSVPAEGNLQRVPRNGLVVVQLRGTEPPYADSESWVVAENSGLTPQAVVKPILLPDGDRGFHSDIDSNGNALRSGTYVFRFHAAEEGYATLRLEREGPSAEQGIAVSYRIKIGDFNSAPIAADDSFDVREDTEQALDVLENDTDIDPGDRLHVSQVGEEPLHGTAEATPDGILYTPNADYTGSDAFTYAASDGRGGESTATITVQVTNVNDAPIAVDDTFDIPADGPEVALPVLDNDIEIDPGDSISISGFPTRPEHGIVRVDGRNVYYTAQPGYHGEDRFTYRIADLSGETSMARVTLLVGET